MLTQKNVLERAEWQVQESVKKHTLDFAPVTHDLKDDDWNTKANKLSYKL